MTSLWSVEVISDSFEELSWPKINLGLPVVDDLIDKDEMGEGGGSRTLEGAFGCAV